MEAFFQQHQSTVYTLAFFGMFALVALWEAKYPRRKLVAPLAVRWRGNFSILGINSLCMWLVFPGFGFASAMFAPEFNIGVFNWLSLPYWFEFAIAFLLLDLGHFAIHYAFHKVKLLWRAHRLHHTDQDFDLTTGARFHPLEAVFEHGANLLVIVLVGPPVAAVILFAVAYLITTFWVHGNIVMPAGIERVIRRLFVTPEMHRIHHSEIQSETDSNYGGLFSFWDRLFGTYVHEPRHGHEGMTIGLKEFRDPRHFSLAALLANPFLSREDQARGAEMAVGPVASD